MLILVKSSHNGTLLNVPLTVGDVAHIFLRPNVSLFVVPQMNR
jgi:hypothetical protein